jgi:hypothetical protein
LRSITFADCELASSGMHVISRKRLEEAVARRGDLDLVDIFGTPSIRIRGSARKAPTYDGTHPSAHPTIPCFSGTVLVVLHFQQSAAN